MAYFANQHRNEIRVIPTDYAGTHFRSRTEARFAAWCDKHGLEWFYEPEGFAMNGVHYLPDFYIPSGKWVVEIKPPMFLHECHKIDAMRIAMPGYHYVVATMRAERIQWLAHNDYNGNQGGDPDLDRSPLPWISNTGWHGSEKSQFMWWCNECTRPFFPTDQAWHCPHCGHYNGDNGFCFWEENAFSGESLDQVKQRLAERRLAVAASMPAAAGGIDEIF
jgi:hypothetical protein